jgi:hypothetical protein
MLRVADRREPLDDAYAPQRHDGDVRLGVGGDQRERGPRAAGAPAGERGRRDQSKGEELTAVEHRREVRRSASPRSR